MADSRENRRLSRLKSGKVTFNVDKPASVSHMMRVIAGAPGLPYAAAEEMKIDPAQEAQLFLLSLPVAQKMAGLRAGRLNMKRVNNIYLVDDASRFSQFADVFSKETGKHVVCSVEPLFVTPPGIAMNAGRG